MNAYSKDLRLRALVAADRGMPRSEVAEVFGIFSMPTMIKRCLKRRRETGEVKLRPTPGPQARKWEALRELLPSRLARNPDLILAEHYELFEEEGRVGVFSATMSRVFERLRRPLLLVGAELDEEER